ncbi:hypothetical protein [Stutzerimonas frequens]|uniref:hypothetical protein n=1 Tax=Stutzerimonas frequens TaxID=2968969 RepID=UPI0040383021
MPALLQSDLVEGADYAAITLIHGTNRHRSNRSVDRGQPIPLRLSAFNPDQKQEQTMLGDYSSINDHLETARKHADQAETEAKPELYREAVDELVAAIRLLMRNGNEKDN